MVVEESVFSVGVEVKQLILFIGLLISYASCVIHIPGYS